MKKNNTTIFKNIILFLLISISTVTFSQEKKLKKANKLYNSYAYIDATKIYLQVAEKGFRSEELLKKLANSYYFNANYVEGVKWYEELFKITDKINPIYFLRYSQCLNATGKEELSKTWFNKYADKVDLSGSEFKNAEEYLDIIDKSGNRYTISNLSINTKGIDFGAGLKDKTTFKYTKLVYASTKQENSNKIKKDDSWSGLSFLNLFEATINEDGSIENSTKLEGDINSKRHESSAIFTKDGKTMYFTRNNTTSRYKNSKNQVNHLKIYRAHLVNDLWTNIEDLSINGDNYSNAHPTLNPSEDKLYFASDMPQTTGLTDIFFARINKDGSLGRPTNLGEKINTKGRESFPFISKDNELYFSSDGHFGLGGYDVFYVKLNGNGYTGGLLNVGEPINSIFDDYAFVIDNHKGFISSNRPEGKGLDDIYSFIENKDIKDLLVRNLSGVVLDSITREPIANATVNVINANNNFYKTFQTDEVGAYNIQIERAISYLVKASKESYVGSDKITDKYTKDVVINFLLQKDIFTVKLGDDIAKLLDVKIYFDLDKYNIRSDAKVELEKIIAVMKENPNLKIDVRSHTDSRADDYYNLRLSQRRNVATLQYLIEVGGISPTRLQGKGYGETELVNACVNGIECSEILHQMNRRSEFIIIK